MRAAGRDPDPATLYASGGVPEYWVVDAVEQSIHVLRSPGMHGYAEHRVVGRGESITPLAAATAGLSPPSLAVEVLFDPRP
ncbi:MAG: Uma2 family endonuclease [Pirellulales bacterium]